MNFEQKYSIVKNTAKNNGLNGILNLMCTLSSLATEPLHLKSRPIFVQIEPTINCNLKCPTCMSPALARQRSRILTLEKFKQILRQLPFVEKISLVGAGEPLLNPELFDIIAYAKAKGLTIGFATNATLMDEEIAQKIISSKVDWLNISLDAVSKELYERIRVGANFDEVCRNISHLSSLISSLKGKEKRPELSIWFLVLKSNIGELHKMVDLAKNLGISKLSAQTVHGWGSQEWKKKVEPEKILVLEELRGALSHAKTIAKEKRVFFEYVNAPDTQSARACKWPWKSCYITVDGYVTPCCLHGANPEVIHFGNIFTEPFDRIWNNTRYQEFRKRLKSAHIPEICLDCPSYYAKVKL